MLLVLRLASNCAYSSDWNLRVAGIMSSFCDTLSIRGWGRYNMEILEERLWGSYRRLDSRPEQVQQTVHHHEQFGTGCKRVSTQ